MLYNYFDYIIHLDRHLNELVQTLGEWSYCVLGCIIFAETGLIVTPFLPGDSLLFIVGTLSALKIFDIKIIIPLLLVAAFLGNTVNYFIGRVIGDKILKSKNSWIIKKKYIEQTQVFYEKHGGKAIVFSRFLPIFRTFAPFVAGIGKMTYSKFLLNNLVGAFLWVTVFVLGGYFFGNISFVKQNFTLIIFAVIFVSFLPAIVFYIKNRLKRNISK